MIIRAVAVILILLVLPAVSEAQQVEFRGRGDIGNDIYLRQLVESGAYTLVSRDTLLARTDTLRGTVLVLGSTLRVEGVIDGDLVIVDSNVFLRPTARLTGGVRNIGGGLYPSEQATIVGSSMSLPNAEYLVERRDETLVIVGTAEPSVITREGLGGLLLPTYDRVNGLSVGVGAGYLLPRLGLVEPVVRGRVTYRSQRGQFDGRGEVAARRGGTELSIGVERTTLTNEQWIRSDMSNSISALLQGKDRRDYYEAERAWVELRRLLETGTRETTAFLRAEVEDAVPLRAAQPWSLLGSFREDNILVDASRISSLTLGASSEWVRPQHVVEVGGLIEAGAEVLDADHSFIRFAADLDWAMLALRDHTLRIQAHAQGPLGTTTLPSQRWSFVGGSGTLHTYDDAEFRGDRVVLIETEYSIPLPERLRLPLLGRPSFDLLHLVGMAWTADETRGLEQNIGLRLDYNLMHVRAVTHPARFADDLEFSVGVRMPGGGSYPWQKDFDTPPENR